MGKISFLWAILPLYHSCVLLKHVKVFIVKVKSMIHLKQMLKT